MQKRPYVSLWLLLAAALMVILVVAFSDDLVIGGKTIKKAPLADLFENQEEVFDSLYTATDSAAVLEEVVVVDSLPQSIFIFGDSMTFHLAQRLAQYAKQNGHTLHAVNWDSSNSKVWADYDTLQYYLRKYHPTHVFITLGSNELYLPKPESRLPSIKKILSVIDTIPYTWIGPPNWEKDNGFNDLLARVCKPGSFFRTEGMSFKRKADKIHPTKESSFDWLDSIVRWLPKSAHPFIVDFPG